MEKFGSPDVSGLPNFLFVIIPARKSELISVHQRASYPSKFRFFWRMIPHIPNKLLWISLQFCKRTKSFTSQCQRRLLSVSSIRSYQPEPPLTRMQESYFLRQCNFTTDIYYFNIVKLHTHLAPSCSLSSYTNYMYL